jgi:hypothetical protein
MSRSSGRSKVKKPKYTQEAANFDKFIKNECFGDSSIREVKVKLLDVVKINQNNYKNLPSYANHLLITLLLNRRA